MPLKYQADLSNQNQPCPCVETFLPREKEAYRFVKSNPASEADFIPPAILSGSQRDSCNRFALSFFDSVENAERLFNKLNKKINAKARYGEFVGKIKLELTDGLMSEPSIAGHIDLHPEDNVTFSNRVTEFQQIEITKTNGGQ